MSDTLRPAMTMPNTAEHRRVSEITDDVQGWRLWGPYVGERAWASVREDYSADGNAWAYLPHDHARSRAYRWGEDGIAGICDRYQLLCFAPAFWNGRDPILKERLFGLTNEEGNRGEDVKEVYHHADNVPTHSYMKYLYRYPHAEYPYRWLIEENRRRGGTGMEFELIDTGIFDEDRYFDIVIEYAKIDHEDIVIKIEAINRGPDPAELHILPHLWYRNIWAWSNPRHAEPTIRQDAKTNRGITLVADDAKLEYPTDIPHEYRLGPRALYASAGGTPLFTNNETNWERFYGRRATNPSPYVKDAFHRKVIHGEDCVDPQQRGTKAAIHYHFPAIPGGQSVVVHLRLSPKTDLVDGVKTVDSTIETRRKEADDFYAAIHPEKATDDEKLIQRQAFAGLLWTKFTYLYDVNKWLEGDDPERPPPENRKYSRNQHWRHLNSMRIMIPAEKWEYPWFAAWDLALTCPAIARVDPAFAKDQLWFLLFDQFLHPSGQLPAYEWEFSDLNPPVHALAVWRIYNMDRLQTGKADRGWLERCFHKLLINFAWWVNKVDRAGNNLFEGGFLGMDNITVVDRSMKWPDGVTLEQSDGTGYMAMFCLNLMRIALELAKENKEYELLAVKFFQHYVYVAAAMKPKVKRGCQLWDEEDGFFYDVLRFPDGHYQKFRVRSLVGLIPLFAVERLETEWIAQYPLFSKNFHWFIKNRKEQVGTILHEIPRGKEKTYVFTVLDDEQISRLMDRVWNEDEFLSDYGIRSLSKVHEEYPFEYKGNVVRYEPAESDNKIKGGNSNWRGPIWFPINFLIIESLRKLGKAFGPDFTLTPPATGGRPITFNAMAGQLADRLIKIFARDQHGRRPVFGGSRKFQEDPHWRDQIFFYEYFHGDEGAGLGAPHQTGWTALVASLIDEWR